MKYLIYKDKRTPKKTDYMPNKTISEVVLSSSVQIWIVSFPVLKYNLYLYAIGG